MSCELIDKSVIKPIKTTWTDYILHTYKEKSLITKQAQYIPSMAGSNYQSWTAEVTNLVLETVLAVNMYDGRAWCFAALCLIAQVLCRRRTWQQLLGPALLILPSLMV